MTAIDIVYSKQAAKFIKKNPHRLTTEKMDGLIRTAVSKINGDNSANIDVISMTGRSKSKFRIRTGDIRIIFSLERGRIIVVFVEEIGFRGDVYKLREVETPYLVAQKSKDRSTG